MIEINLRKSREIRVKATSTRKGHTRKIQSKGAQRETEIWKAWQEHYRQNLFRPSNEPHEDMFSTVIMIAQSPAAAALKLQELQKKYPSSVGGDLAKEFRKLYFKTRHDVMAGGSSPMSGWIQTERQTMKMIELELEKIIGTGRTKVQVHRESGTTMEYRRTGRKSSGRAGTGKIDKLPQNIRDEILDLRRRSYSGTKIKDRIESMIDMDDTMRQDMLDANVATLSDKGFKLSVTPQGLLDYAKKRGAVPQTKHSGPKSIEESQAQEKERHEETKRELERANEKNIRLEVDVKELRDHFEADRKEIKDLNALRDDVRTDLLDCRAQLAKK